MSKETLDCTWCGSARSIEHGICQICLMEYPLDTQVIELPRERTPVRRSSERLHAATKSPQRPATQKPSLVDRVVKLTDSGVGVAE